MSETLQGNPKSKVISQEQLAEQLGMSVEKMLEISQQIVDTGAGFFRSSDGTEGFVGGVQQNEATPEPEA